MATRKRQSRRDTKKQTFVALVVDRSGSMEGKEKAAVSGVNEQLNTLRSNAKKGGTTKVALIQFNSEIETLYSGVRAEHLEEFTRDQYHAIGGTSLRDATMRAINTLQEMCQKETEDTAFLIIVVSDGEENSSKIPAWQLAAEIQRLQGTDKWTFSYMLSNTDLSKFTQDYGVHYRNVSSFNSTNNVGVANGMANVSLGTSNYFTMRESGITNSSNFYSGDSGNINLNDQTKIIPQDVNVTITGVDSGGGIFGPKKTTIITPTTK